MSQFLILTVGLPRSGKSTWAKQQGVPVVCPDEIRLELHGQRHLPEREPEVWQSVTENIYREFRQGQKVVILDAQGSSISRAGWRDLAWRTRRAYRLRYAVFLTTPAECIRRAELTFPDLVSVIQSKAELGEPTNLTAAEWNKANIIT